MPSPANESAKTADPQTTADVDDALERSLQTDWDARLVSYDEAAFPFRQWMEDRVRLLGYDIKSLETLHETVDPDRVYVLSKELCAATREPEFVDMVRRFTRDFVAVEGRLEPPLGIQRFLNVRVMLPSRPQGVFPFHTGLLYGHGAGSRSLWMPLTDVRAPERASASLQIVGLDESRELINYANEKHLGVDEMSELFGARSHPVSAGPGDVLFFTQENLHGNFVNETGRTRVSIDFRIAEERFGDRLARKIPGGYFELLGEGPGSRPGAAPAAEPIAADEGLSNLIYLHNNTPSTVAVPVHLQRLMVLDYCRSRELDYHFEYFELEGMDHLPTLMHALEELRCNILLYSVYALPESPEFRGRILKRARERGLAMHFVNEDIIVRTAADEKSLERLLRFARHGSGKA